MCPHLLTSWCRRSSTHTHTRIPEKIKVETFTFEFQGSRDCIPCPSVHQAKCMLNVTWCHHHHYQVMLIERDNTSPWASEWEYYTFVLKDASGDSHLHSHLITRDKNNNNNFGRMFTRGLIVFEIWPRVRDGLMARRLPPLPTTTTSSKDV